MRPVGGKRATITVLGDTEFVITREFPAPARAVFHAYTTPELVRRWWPGQRGEVTVCEIDLSVGGKWRYVLRTHGGVDVAFHGVYREIVPNERIVSTEVYEAMAEHPALSTATFVEVDGRTTLSIAVAHATRTARDLHLQSGMEDGMNESLDLLEQIVAGKKHSRRARVAP